MDKFNGLYFSGLRVMGLWGLIEVSDELFFIFL
jgi:hypothetical protein